MGRASLPGGRINVRSRYERTSEDAIRQDLSPMHAACASKRRSLCLRATESSGAASSKTSSEPGAASRSSCQCAPRNGDVPLVVPQPYTGFQCAKSRIVPQRIEPRVDSQVRQPARVFAVRFVEQVEGTIGIAEPYIDERDGIRGNVLMPAALLELGKNLAGIVRT